MRLYRFSTAKGTESPATPLSPHSGRFVHTARRAAVFCSLVLLLLISGCGEAGSPFHSDSGFSLGLNDSETAPAKDSQEFDSFLEDLFCSEISCNTINLHYTLSHPEDYGIMETPITLGDISEGTVLESSASMENALAVLNGFDYESLSPSQQLSYDVVSDYLTTELGAADFYLYDEVLRPSTGIQAQLPVLYEEYRFEDEQDIKDYLALIALTGDYFDQIISFEEKKADAGLFMADFACETIISQCRDFIADADSHYLVETFNNKVDSMTALSQEAREGYKLENEALVKDTILPAYEKLANALEGFKGKGTNDRGLCYFTDGTRYYEYLVYHNTGCSDTIGNIEKMINKQRAIDLQDAADLTKEDTALWERCNEVSLSNTDAATTLAHLQEAMLADFPAPPDTRSTVSYIDECMEDYLAPAFYITSPIDDYVDNSIFINRSTDTSTMEYFTTLAHEGYPGHLYQTVMSYEAGLPDIRFILNYPGYVEGWATYVEMMSYHYAGLDEDVASLLELNQSAILSLYASTDIGIHYDGWSLDATITFWEKYGISNENAIRQIYELIVEEPAHYLKYYVGYLQFLELKDTAQKKYLLKYDDAAFHQAVLDIGPAPFAIIEKYLDDYYVAP